MFAIFLSWRMRSPTIPEGICSSSTACWSCINVGLRRVVRWVDNWTWAGLNERAIASKERELAVGLRIIRIRE